MDKKRIKKKLSSIEPNNIVDLIVLTVIFAFLLDYFKPELILLKTTVSGGDTGSHNYLVYYMRNYLLPHGKIVGWSPDWYAGFPIFQFYFPFPYLLAALMSYLIPIEIATKLITVLGIFLLPVCAYFSLKLMDFRFPVPIIAAMFTLPFLFLETFSIWGGNILSTLAGQFAFSLSLSLAVLFFGGFYRYMRTKSEILLVLDAILLMFIVLSHIIPVIVIVLSSSFFILGRERLKNFLAMSRLFILAFLLSAFWALPFIVKKGHATPGNFLPDRDIGLLFPKELLPFLLLTVLGILFWHYNKEEKDERISYLLFSTSVSAILFILAPKGFILNTRFLPFFYVFSMIVAAYGLSEILRKFEAKWLVILIVLIGSIYFINSSVTKMPHWIKWNYEGFENKNSWGTFSSVNEFLLELPDGRVIHEYSNLHNSFGTPRAFESIPYFAKKPVMEGLLMESAISSPYHFFLQSEISETPTCPLAGSTCPPFNIEKGAEHIRLFNIKYVVATSTKLKEALKTNNNFNFLKKFNNIEIYEVETDGKYVVSPKYEPVLIHTSDWRDLSQDWFKNGDPDIPLVFLKTVGKEDSDYFHFIDSGTSEIPKISLNNSCNTEEKVENEEIFIKTTCIGKPLLIKIPYFPNWKVEGAKKIYLASPAFMMIFPTQENVRIFYGDTLIDIIGKLLSIAGLIFSIILINRNRNPSSKQNSLKTDQGYDIINQNLTYVKAKINEFNFPFDLPKLKKKYQIEFILILLILGYTYIFSRTAILKHSVYGTSGFDLGIFDQGIWLLSQGKTPFVTVRGLNLFGDHVSFILLLISPIYWFWNDVRAILILQSFVLAIGAIPVYLISKNKFKSKNIALAFSISYLLYPSLEYVNLWHFHPESLATTFVLFAIYFITAKNFNMYYVFIFLSLICKEEVSLVLFLMGVYIYKGYNRKVGFTTSVISLVWFALSIKVFLPYFNEAGYFGLSYGYGLTQLKIDVIISRLFTRETGQYLFYLLGPVAFLSLLSPLLLLVSAPIFVSNLVGSPYMRTINYQYTALIIPFIFLSAIYGTSRLYNLFNFKKKEQFFIALLLVSAFFSSYYFGPTPLSKTRPQYFITDRVKVTNLGLDLIPPKAAVSADPFIVPHLSHREKIYEFPNPFKVSNWGINDKNPHDPNIIEYIVVKRDSLSKENKEIITKLLQEGRFQIIFDQDEVLILSQL